MAEEEEVAAEQEAGESVDGDGPFETDVKKPASPLRDGREEDETERMGRKSKRKRVKSREPAREEIEAAVDLLVHGVPAEDFDPMTLKYCVQDLMNMKRDAVSSKRYVDADFYAQLIKQIHKALDISNFSKQCTQHLTDLIEKRADAENKLEACIEMWGNLFEEFESTVDAKRKTLNDLQNQELEEFDASRPAELPPQYLKHSIEYVLLRKRENILLKLEDYLSAEQVRKMADRIESKELSHQHVRLQDDLERRRNALIEKHGQQFEAFAIWLNCRRHELLRKRANEVEALEKRFQHYTAMIERIEKKGLPPNPTSGFTTNMVSRKESVKAVRAAAQSELEKDAQRRQNGEKQSVTVYRPTSAVMIMNSPVLRGVQGGDSEKQED
jgi:hypothetical protein